jgi:hypothetical protein
MERVGRDARCSAPHGGLGFFILLLMLAAATSAACQRQQVSEGVGGQSGDEGRRDNPSWLGTGGVGAVPSLP